MKKIERIEKRQEELEEQRLDEWKEKERELRWLEKRMEIRLEELEAEQSELWRQKGLELEKLKEELELELKLGKMLKRELEWEQERDSEIAR